jgi:hypothetical protein
MAKHHKYIDEDSVEVITCTFVQVIMVCQLINLSEMNVQSQFKRYLKVFVGYECVETLVRDEESILIIGGIQLYLRNITMRAFYLEINKYLGLSGIFRV